jgi:molecular chaperone GrpE
MLRCVCCVCLQRSLHTLSAVRPASTSVRLAVAATAPLQQTRVATLQSCRCFSTESNASTSSNGKDTATPSNGNGAAAAASSNGPAVDVAKLQAEHAKAIEEKEAKIKELNDRYMHALAESQNTLTRSMTQVNDAKKFAVQSFAKQLLEVADVLEIATKAAEDQAKVATDPAFKNLHEGMTMTHKVLLQIFERNGLKKFEPLNEKVSPTAAAAHPHAEASRACV